MNLRREYLIFLSSIALLAVLFAASVYWWAAERIGMLESRLALFDGTDGVDTNLLEEEKGSLMEYVISLKREEFAEDIQHYSDPLSDWVEIPEDVGFRIFYPDDADWKFSCCGDTETKSTHVILPIGYEVDQSKDIFVGPYPGTRIAVTEYNLINGRDSETDAFLSITPDEQMILIAERRLQDDMVEQLDTFYVAGMQTTAQVYQGEGWREYVINTATDVVSITFNEYEGFGEEFISEFLRRLVRSESST